MNTRIDEVLFTKKSSVYNDFLESLFFVFRLQKIISKLFRQSCAEPTTVKKHSITAVADKYSFASAARTRNAQKTPTTFLSR
jgi:hypothetical protein